MMVAIKTEYERVVLGATCAGLGAVLARPEEALLIETTASAGWDFVETFRPGAGWEEGTGSGLHPLAQALRQELLERDALAAGRIHLPGLGAVLFNRLYRSGAGYLFLTSLLSVQPDPAGAGYEVRLYSRSGIRTIRARQVLDTTPAFQSCPRQSPVIAVRRIGANLHLPQAGPAAAAPLAGPGYEVLPGRFAGEAYLQLELPVGSSWPEAREALDRFWTERPEPLRAWRLASVGTRLFECPAGPAAREGGPGWSHLPSALCGGPLPAFSAGAQSALASSPAGAI